MAEILQFPTLAERPSKADRAFSPIVSQETLDRRVNVEKYLVALRYVRHAIIWGVIWMTTLVAIGVFTNV